MSQIYRLCQVIKVRRSDVVDIVMPILLRREPTCKSNCASSERPLRQSFTSARVNHANTTVMTSRHCHVICVIRGGLFGQKEETQVPEASPRYEQELQSRSLQLVVNQRRKTWWQDCHRSNDCLPVRLRRWKQWAESRMSCSEIRSKAWNCRSKVLALEANRDEKMPSQHAC